MSKVDKESTKVGLCSPIPGGALSAPSTSPCLSSPRLRAESTASKPRARTVTLSATLPSTFRSPVVLGAHPSPWMPSRSAEGAAPPRRWLTSALQPRPPKHGTPSTAATARNASRVLQGSGSRITRNVPKKTVGGGTSRTPTASPSTSTTLCYAHRLASVRSAERTSRTRTGEPESSSGFRLTTATKRAKCVGSSARSATGRSGCSTTTRHFYARQSATCFVTAGKKLAEGGYCPPFIKEGSSHQ